MDINSINPELRDQLPKDKIEVVYGFILGFSPNTVIAIENEGKLRLPGGIVEGAGEPSGCDDGQHFQPLVCHVKQQTGLSLAGISSPIAVSIFDGDLGPSVSVLYVGKSTGRRTAGKAISMDAIPEFDSICPVTDSQIRAFLQNPTGVSGLWRTLRSVFRR